MQDRPSDPIDYLAHFLKKYATENPNTPAVTNIPPEVEERLKSGRAITPGVIQRIHQQTEDDEEALLDIQNASLIKSLDSPDTEDADTPPPPLSHPTEEGSAPSPSSELNQIESMDSEEDEEETESHLIKQSGTRDDRGQSVLHFAAARPGGASTILAFLQNPSVNLAWRDEQFRTARDVAKSLGRSENWKVVDNWVVSLAVSGDKAAVESLLLDGYTPLSTLEDSAGNHIIDLTEKAGKRDVSLFLRQIPEFLENLENLHDAVRKGDLEGVKALSLKDGRLPYALTEKGKTALHVAVLCEEFAVVKFLCERFGGVTTGESTWGNLLKRGDHLDRTPLHYAMGVEKVEKMTRILVRNGAKRVVKDLRGRQPSYYFINREEIVALQKEERGVAVLKE